MGAGDGEAERAAFDAEIARIRALRPREAFGEAGRLIDRHTGFQAVGADLRAEQVLRIYEDEGGTMEQIAASLGIRKQRVSQLVQRARDLAAAGSLKPEPQPVVSAVVTSRKGVLVTRRRDKTPLWAFVGGQIDQGESPADAGIRELKEETGMEAVAGPEIGRRIHPQTGRLMIYMAARAARGKTDVFVGDERELEEVRWVTLPEALALMPTMYEPVAAYLARTLRK